MIIDRTFKNNVERFKYLTNIIYPILKYDYIYIDDVCHCCITYDDFNNNQFANISFKDKNKKELFSININNVNKGLVLCEI